MYQYYKILKVRQAGHITLYHDVCENKLQTLPTVSYYPKPYTVGHKKD